MPKRGASDSTAVRGKRRRGPAAHKAEADEDGQALAAATAAAPAQAAPQHPLAHTHAHTLGSLQLHPSLLAAYTTAALAAAAIQQANAGAAAAGGTAGGGGGSGNCDDDDGEGEDEGEAEDQEEAGAGAGPSGAPSSRGPPDINATAQQLVKLTGIPLETALNALRETQERVLAGGDGGGGSGGAAALQHAWLEEAQIYLACNMELQEEIQDVGLAMRESLQEYEAAKAAEAETPLEQRPPDYLRDRFAPPPGSAVALAGAPRSAVFAALAACACNHALFGSGTEEGAGDGGGRGSGSGGGAGSHKAGLVKLMELECKCRRWYPGRGTSRFWEQLAAECVAAAADAAGSPPALPQGGWIGCAQSSSGGCATCAAALGGGAAAADADAPGSSGAGTAPAPPKAALGSLAERRAGEVQAEVCKMPTISGQVPDVFAALEDPPGAGGDGDAGDGDGDLIEVIES